MHYFDTGHGGLRYHDWPGQGVPLLFVPGLGCAGSADWVGVAAHPALAGHRRLVVDLLGSGFSDKPADFPYSISAHARTLHDLLQALALPAVRLVGHSMGGAVAIELAGLLGERASALTLLEPNLDAGGGVFSRAVAAQSEARFAETGQRRMAAMAAKEGSKLWAGTLASCAPQAVHRAAVSLVAGAQPSWREQLLALRLPRCVVFGQRSLPDEDLHRLPPLGVAVAVLPDAGHAMSEDNPGELARLLARLS